MLLQLRHRAWPASKSNEVIPAQWISPHRQPSPRAPGMIPPARRLRHQTNVQAPPGQANRQAPCICTHVFFPGIRLAIAKSLICRERTQARDTEKVPESTFSTICYGLLERDRWPRNGICEFVKTRMNSQGHEEHDVYSTASGSRTHSRGNLSDNRAVTAHNTPTSDRMFYPVPSQEKVRVTDESYRKKHMALAETRGIHVSIKALESIVKKHNTDPRR